MWTAQTTLMQTVMHGHTEHINNFGMKTLHIICAYFTALLHEQSLSLPYGM